jgi:hypothetical protein
VDDINAHRDVVGTDVSVAHRPVMAWVAFDVLGDGPIEKIPIEDLLSPEDRDEWEIYWAWAINDSRQMAGRGRHNGVERAFLMTPDDGAASGYADFRASAEADGSRGPAGVAPAFTAGASRIVEDVRDLPAEIGPNRRLGSVGLLSSIEAPEVSETPANGGDAGSSVIAPRVPRRPRPLPPGAGSSRDREPVGRDGTPPESAGEADTDRTTDLMQRNDD